MHKLRIGLATVLVAAAIASGAARAAADEIVSRAADRQLLAVTVYGNGVALIAEGRRVDLPAGAASVAFEDVSPRLIPGSADLQVPRARVVEQAYAFDTLTPEALLEHSVGRTVKVIRTHPTTGAESATPARVLSAAGGPVLETDGRIETGIPGRLAFDGIPPGLRARPALIARLDADGAGERAADLRYLTEGLTWQADYTATLHEGADGARLDVTAWATVRNDGPVSFEGAALSLVAGSVNRVSTAEPQPQPRMEMAALAQSAPGPAGAEREGLGDLHLYRVPGTADLLRGRVSQFRLLDLPDMVVARTHLLRGQPRLYFGPVPHEPDGREHPDVVYRFTAPDDTPLPAGVLRLYGADKAGNPRFLGEDRVAPTPSGRDVDITVGQAFDVTADRTQTGYRKLGPPEDAVDVSVEIVLGNAGDRAVTVVVREPIPGDWRIVEASGPARREGGAAVWDVAVPPGGAETLRYTVRITR